MNMGAYTSNSLQKLVEKLMDKKKKIINEIDRSYKFTASISEDLEILKTENELDIKDCFDRINTINDTILKIKHAKNEFNSTYVMPINGITIDKAIIELAMLNEKKSILFRLSECKEKDRVVRPSGKEPEYEYITYNRKLAKSLYDLTFDRIQSIQEELNSINSNIVIEVDIDEGAISSL